MSKNFKVVNKYYCKEAIPMLCYLLLCFSLSGQSITNLHQLDSLFEMSLENHPDQAMVHVLAMEKMEVDPIKKLEILEKKAQCYLLLDQLDKAMALRYDILTKYESMARYDMVVRTMYNLGNQFFQMQDYKRGIEMFNRAKLVSIDKGNPIDTIKINLEIGLHLAGLDRFEEGIDVIKKNLILAKKHLSEEDWAIGMDNLSSLYHEKNDFENALKYQLEVYKTAFVHSTIHNKTAIHQHLAEIYIKLQRYKLAQFHLDSAFHYGKILGSKDWLFDCYKNQYQIDRALGDYKAALNSHEQYLSLKDSVYKSQYDTKMSAMANLYELNTKQSQISELALKAQLSNTKVQRLTLGLMALALLGGLLYLYYTIRRKIEVQETQKRYSKLLLETQEEERQRIAKELHDSIGQNVLFIKNQIKKIFADTQPQLSSSVDGILENVRCISKDLYPNELEHYGLENAVELLAQQVSKEFGIFVSCDLTGIDACINKNIKINLYRIIQEFINNSLKHAQSKAIRITSQRDGKSLEMILQDNGVGFDSEHIKQKSNRSFGLLNIQERINMLGGKLIFETGIGKGTKFVIHLPVS